jgi:hypothetical protein
LEKDRDDVLGKERAKTFEETQKLVAKVNDLQRDLDKKTNEELGEGAEIDLFEALKAQFPDDDIQRVAKGASGADVIHVVMLNRKPCGTSSTTRRITKHFGRNMSRSCAPTSLPKRPSTRSFHRTSFLPAVAKSISKTGSLSRIRRLIEGA